MKITPVRTALFREGEDIVAFIIRHVTRLPERAVLAVSSKIVALAEGRTAPIKDREHLIKKESARAVRTKHTWLTEKDGMLMAAAGIDESNAGGKLVLLPRDPFTSAREIHFNILQNVRMKKLGVIITDSRIFPMRAGVTGVALGYAGFKGLRDYRGAKDLFGRKLAITQTNVVDCLATAAVLLMGEGRERQPLAVIEDAPVEFTGRVFRRELLMDPAGDLYAPLLRHFASRGRRAG